jgi:sigma-B regulation protein RsbU (phosphoserine phosphatase)
MELLILEPEGESKTVPLQQGSLSLGRSADNDLPYPTDQWLSRYHLRFEQENGRWSIRDCESRNGTIVNSVNLKQPRILHPGDRIYAGHLTIEVRAEPKDEIHNEERNGDGRDIVSFVPTPQVSFEEKGTLVTNLERVLGQTRLDSAGSAQQTARADVTLATTRVVGALIRAGQELSSHRPLPELFEVILDLALSAVEAKRGVILTVEKEPALKVRASKGADFTISTSVRERVLRDKCSLVISDAQLDESFKEQKSIVMHKVRSVMAVPLQTGDRVIGLIYVDTGDLLKPFSQEDLDLLTVMANVAAIRIEQARLVEVEQSEKLMESELASACEIQRSLLPTENPDCPGYDIAGFNLACRRVGGDYYDFIPYRDGRLAIVVGDVAGKGMAASLLMSSLQAFVHMLTESSPDPAVALTVLNRNVAKRCPPGRFITFFYGLLDPATGKLQYANAGHNYPLLVKADSSVMGLAGHAMVLGILDSVTYQAFETQLAPGDMLALFSDGVTEARTAKEHQEFGEQRLAGFLAARRDQPAAKIIDELVNYVRSWSGQPTFADDFTVVLVRRK